MRIRQEFQGNNGTARTLKEQSIKLLEELYDILTTMELLYCLIKNSVIPKNRNDEQSGFNNISMSWTQINLMTKSMLSFQTLF